MDRGVPGKLGFPWQHRGKRVWTDIENCTFKYNWAVTCDFQQCGILTSVDSYEPVQPTFNLRNSKWCLVNSLTLIEYSSDWQRLWSDCAYAQADLRLCWFLIPYCWKSHVAAHILLTFSMLTLKTEGVLHNWHPLVVTWIIPEVDLLWEKWEFYFVIYFFLYNNPLWGILCGGGHEFSEFACLIWEVTVREKELS